MFWLKINESDLRRIRFAYSPLAEATESLHMLGRGPVPNQYREWFEMIRSSLGRVDMPLLRAVVPPGREVACFMFMGAADTGTTIERQLQLIADYPADQLRRDLSTVWKGTGLPTAAQRLAADGPAQLVDALWEYWQVAIGPQWSRIRALLDADVAYRTGRLANSGIEGLLADLHPGVKLHDSAIQVGTRGSVTEYDLSGEGLRLIPCAFAWPCLEVDFGRPWPPHLVYGARGIGALWHDELPAAAENLDVLGELLGRSRAAILVGVALPMSTTDLARQLGQSPPAVSAHLSVLRRSGLVTSRRAGRRVLYQRTPLATSIITVSRGIGDRQAS